MDRVGRRGKKEKPTSPSESFLPIKEGAVGEGLEPSFPSRLIPQGNVRAFSLGRLLSGVGSPRSSFSLSPLSCRHCPSPTPLPPPTPALRPSLSSFLSHHPFLPHHPSRARPTSPTDRPARRSSHAFAFDPPLHSLPSFAPSPSLHHQDSPPSLERVPSGSMSRFRHRQLPRPTLSSSCLLLLPISHLALGTFCALPPPSSSLPFPPHPSHASTSSPEPPFMPHHSFRGPAAHLPRVLSPPPFPHAGRIFSVPCSNSSSHCGRERMEKRPIKREGGTGKRPMRLGFVSPRV